VANLSNTPDVHDYLKLESEILDKKFGRRFPYCSASMFIDNLCGPRANKPHDPCNSSPPER